MRYFFWLLALSFAQPALAQRQPPHKQKPITRKEFMKAQQTKAAIGATAPVLIVQRTPCHGTCPVYKAAIYADGRVEYEGERFVSLIGKHTLSLPVATVTEMLAEAKRISFNKLQDRYAGDTYDLPSTIITVQPAGQPAKSVYAMQDIPENLQGYIDYLTKRLDPLTNNVQEK